MFQETKTGRFLIAKRKRAKDAGLQLWIAFYYWKKENKFKWRFLLFICLAAAATVLANLSAFTDALRQLGEATGEAVKAAARVVGF